MVVSAHWQDVFSLIPPQITPAGNHLWPFDPICPVDVRFWSFTPKTVMPPSRHDYLEVLYVISGGLNIDVEGREVQVHDGELFVMGGSLLHRVTECVMKGSQAVTLYFLPGFICPSGIGGESGQYLRPFLDQDRQFPHLVGNQSGLPMRVFELMVRIQSEMRGEQSGARLMVRAYLQVLLAELFRHYATCHEISRRRSHDLERVRAAIEFLDENHAERVTLQDAAAVLRMSRTQFVRVFRQATGQSFLAYLHQLRVEHAKQLLSGTEKSIAEISQEVGFGNQSYFGAVFRELVQMSPRDFRRRVTNPPPEIHGPV